MRENVAREILYNSEVVLHKAREAIPILLTFSFSSSFVPFYTQGSNNSSSGYKIKFRGEKDIKNTPEPFGKIRLELLVFWAGAKPWLDTI